MKRKSLLWLGLICLPFLAYSQQPQPTRVYQLSGLIFSKIKEEPVPYVRVQINNTKSGVMSNSEGFYSIPVTEDDTLYFNHIGFFPMAFVIRDYLQSYQGESQYIYAVNYLEEDTLTLDPVVIFPYETPEEIKTAVVNMDFLANSPESFARRNLDPRVIHAIAQTIPKDGDERLLVGRQLYADRYQSQNILPTAGLNAIAAMRFLQYVAQKAKKRKNKDLNYWE